MTISQIEDLFNASFLLDYLREYSLGHSLLEIKDEKLVLSTFFQSAYRNLFEINHSPNIKFEDKDYANYLANIVLNITKNKKEKFVVIDNTAEYSNQLMAILCEKKINGVLVPVEKLTSYRASVVVLTSSNAYSLETAGKNKSAIIIESYPSGIHPKMDRLLTDLGYQIIPDLWCVLGFIALHSNLPTKLVRQFAPARISRKSQRVNLRYRLLAQGLGCQLKKLGV